MSKPNGQHLYYSIITTSAYLIIQWVQQHLISERSELNNFLKLFFHVKKIANFSYCALILMGKVQNCVSISKGFDNKFWDEKNLSPWLILKSFSIWLKGMKHESFRVLAPQNELPPPKMPQDLPQQLEISFSDEWCYRKQDWKCSDPKIQDFEISNTNGTHVAIRYKKPCYRDILFWIHFFCIFLVDDILWWNSKVFYLILERNCFWKVAVAKVTFDSRGFEMRPSILSCKCHWTHLSIRKGFGCTATHPTLFLIDKILLLQFQSRLTPLQKVFKSSSRSKQASSTLL